VLRVWQITSPQDMNSRPQSSVELLRIAQPASNHNGGGMVFDTQSNLYIALGDGGSADDEFGNGQNSATPLGAILRIDPLGTNSSNGKYGIPADNPFVNQPDTLDEIYALGLRNPFRISFDSVSGQLFAADVGQHQIEEINLITAGCNYGWPLKEGSFTFHDNGEDKGFISNTAIDDSQLTDPVTAYDHDEGISVIGGFVNREHETSSLQGLYIFADLAQIFNRDGRLFYWSEGHAIREFSLTDQQTTDMFIMGFAQDAQGAMYVLGNQSGNTSDSSGQVWRIMPETSVSLDSGELYLPVLNVDGQALQVSLQLTDSESLTFSVQLDSLLSLPAGYLNSSSDAHYDATTGLLTLPAVTLGTGESAVRYSVTLQQLDTGADLQFMVQDVQVLE